MTAVLIYGELKMLLGKEQKKPYNRWKSTRKGADSYVVIADKIKAKSKERKAVLAEKKKLPLFMS